MEVITTVHAPFIQNNLYFVKWATALSNNGETAQVIHAEHYREQAAAQLRYEILIDEMIRQSANNN